ncbi:MAG: hypothetical protein YK1309IOTA_1060002 [Marine Group I thaumarchaeote]|nr:MAG: hypothetical protein YK1309IOTA_1060002 [Marine Group I thaumarchaeote]
MNASNQSVKMNAKLARKLAIIAVLTNQLAEYHHIPIL